MPTDQFTLVSREEIQFRFGLTSATLKLWLEAAPEDRCPHIIMGKTSPMFHVPTFFKWLVAKFGQGNWEQDPPTA